MASARTVIIAGAGIGGLTAALSLAKRDLISLVLEQADRLEEAGAGLQLAPNATRILIDLGLRPLIERTALVPQAIRVMSARFAREVVRIPLGAAVEARYGAPYWIMHRADLQAALAEAVRGRQEITLKLDARVEDFAVHSNGVTVQWRSAGQVGDDTGIALVGADGIWSSVRARLRRDPAPKFRNRTAWRALVPTESVIPEFREPLVHLWLGQDAHVVHYPVKGGALINIVVIVQDQWRQQGWTSAGESEELLRHFSRWDWAQAPRDLLSLPERWQKWALFDRPRPHRGGRGPVTLLGDAAHPMLPFLAQGAGTAIEDGPVLADALANNLERPTRALRRYERTRRPRTTKVQRASRRQARIYGMSGPEGYLRNLFMRARGGDSLLKRYDWLYNWRPPTKP
ncbi:MAG TPA: FAD-dependent monooxygenase [Pseudolabrys sp.]|nr:FAD-dependent monooxygenase [Pseudolabrys sp.]